MRRAWSEQRIRVFLGSLRTEENKRTAWGWTWSVRRYSSSQGGSWRTKKWTGIVVSYHAKSAQYEQTHRFTHWHILWTWAGGGAQAFILEQQLSAILSLPDARVHSYKISEEKDLFWIHNAGTHQVGCKFMSDNQWQFCLSEKEYQVHWACLLGVYLLFLWE